MDISKIEMPALRADGTTQRSVVPVGERASVLIVDDTPSKLTALGVIVSGMALEIVTANSGQQALRQILKRDFAVILLDVNMPTMDGFETAKLIRSRPRSAHTPIIFVTAEAHSEAQRLSGYTLGAVDFIGSPIIPEILRAKVQVFVNLFDLQRQVLLHNEQLESLVAQRTAALASEREALRESENRFRVIFECMADALLLFDPGSGQFIDCNQAATDMLRCTDKKEILLLHPAQFSPLHQPDGRRSDEKADEMIATALRHGNHRFEWIRCSDHREDFPVEVLLTPILLGERQLILTTWRDISERKRIDRMKSEFISTVSHELRTPLTSIFGSLGLIAGGVAGELPEAVKNLVGIAKNNCERLIRLINDLLDSEKIESGKMHLILQVVDIRPLVQQALATNESLADQHRVTVLLRAPDEPLEVRIDRDRLTQVLTNLLSNAVKFSPPEGTVEVRVSRVAQQVRVEIADHGPGIPEEFKSRIFQKFSQADASDTKQKGGTGLGLNISKALIEQMGGQIGFSSQVGAGSTFFFELPEWKKSALLPGLNAR